jgi:hypothetical protein
MHSTPNQTIHNESLNAEEIRGSILQASMERLGCALGPFRGADGDISGAEGARRILSVRLWGERISQFVPSQSPSDAGTANN